MNSRSDYRICFPKHGSFPSDCEPSVITVPVAKGVMQPQDPFTDTDTGMPVISQGRQRRLGPISSSTFTGTSGPARRL